jgi:hypothetical protein
VGYIEKLRFMKEGCPWEHTAHKEMNGEYWVDCDGKELARLAWDGIAIETIELFFRNALAAHHAEVMRSVWDQMVDVVDAASLYAAGPPEEQGRPDGQTILQLIIDADQALRKKVATA